MSRAEPIPITFQSIIVSDLIQSPFVRAAFRRAERDPGRTFAVPREPSPTLAGGAAEPIPQPDKTARAHGPMPRRGLNVALI
jgi:hypothetical protein